MRRSKHTLSHYRMHTCRMGELIPVQFLPVLPGDTIQCQTQAVIRMSPLNTPVMHPTVARIHHWFVPTRVVAPEWEDFITGGPDGNDSWNIPEVFQTNEKKNLLSYLGMPPCPTANRTVNGLPLRAVNEIYNKRYRDQDLGVERAAADKTVPRIAWEKDDLTSARPFAQKGPAVTLPIGSAAPIRSLTDTDGAGLTIGAVTDGNAFQPRNNATTRGLQYESSAEAAGTANLYADLSAAGAIDVNDFREAFAKQRYQEARARYGSRFTEYLRYLGIRPSDARLQDPEYLGGGTARLQFSEVLQTAPSATGGTSETTGVGDLFGHGIAGARTPRFRKFFEEHGFVITLLSIRPKTLYLNGVHREFLKETKEDFFQKELANLGAQTVKRGQVFLDQDGYKDDWAFQDRYDEYRSHPSFVGQDFRDVLSSWHMGRSNSDTTELNESFVQCNPSEDIFQAATNDTCWIMINNRVVARRLVPKRANPRIL